MATMGITELYMNMLNSLSDEEKLELIAKLADSMRHQPEKTEVDGHIFDCFHTDWGEKGDAEQLPDSSHPHHFH